jgi:transcriptional regulator with XRE-family HTH domain
MTEESAQKLAGYIKRLRQDKRWGVRELARRAGLDAAVIVHLESGRARHPRLDTLRSLASALETPLADMLAEAGQAMQCGGPCIATHLRVCYSQLTEAAVRDIEAYVNRAVEAAPTANQSDPVQSNLNQEWEEGAA